MAWQKPPVVVRAVMVISVAYAALIIGGNLMLWGTPFAISIVDPLHKPAKVTRWEPNGLYLSDGRVVMPTGMTLLPEGSDTLDIATREGVEVAPDGRVFGLIKLWHWCGNDPVRHHLGKIDIAQLLSYHQEGKSTLKPHRYAERGFKEMGGGSERGWSTSARTQMRMNFDPKFKDIFADSK